MTDVEAKIRAVFRERVLAVLATVTEDGKPWARYVGPALHDDTARSVPTT